MVANRLMCRLSFGMCGRDLLLPLSPDVSPASAVAFSKVCLRKKKKK